MLPIMYRLLIRLPLRWFSLAAMASSVRPLFLAARVISMKEPMVITMAREYASGGSEIAQAVADKLGIPLYNKELITQGRIGGGRGHAVQCAQLNGGIENAA